jgi:hypothetical protein
MGSFEARDMFDRSLEEALNDFKIVAWIAMSFDEGTAAIVDTFFEIVTL